MIEGTKLTYSDFVTFAETQEEDSEQSDETETEEEISFVVPKSSSKNRRKIISDDELSNEESEEEFDSNGKYRSSHSYFRMKWLEGLCVNTVLKKLILYAWCIADNLSVTRFLSQKALN